MDERPEPGERAQVPDQAAPRQAGITPLPVPLTTALPPRLEAWRRRSFTGAIMTGVALGLAEALEVPRAEVAIVAETPGEPPGPPRRMQVELDPDDPTQASVVIRPWLFSGSEAGRHPTHPASLARLAHQDPPDHQDPEGSPPSG